MADNSGTLLRSQDKATAASGDFQISLIRSEGASLGLDLEMRKPGVYIRVKEVKEEGLVSEWNASHGPDLQVKPGHLLVSVNGTSGTSQEVLDTLRTEQDLEITLRWVSPAPAQVPDEKSSKKDERKERELNAVTEMHPGGLAPEVDTSAKLSRGWLFPWCCAMESPPSQTEQK
eukprot:CAMPEP_0197906798 /NCGR_PEP_ID=MMETSP1439-20131203/63497_1 /TAXON_ID=66791 /ORGANISM="Gonyaulax spinifera, Strain CCMP409" /LENGTH=173 /DNA_ID=CAMNT_0043528191 /DNA_START=107 /DNA_END=628 /DNA_ORIENTATION=-